MTRSTVDTEERAAPRPPDARPAARPGGGRRRRVNIVAIGLFLLPALVLFTLLVLVPIMVAAYTSLFKWNGFGGVPTNFIGLDNFTRMLKDKVFLGDLRHGVILILLSVAIQLPLALGIALLLNQKLRGRAVFRLLFFAPYVLSEVIAGVLFNMLFNGDRGLANEVFRFFGVDSPPGFTDNPDIVLYTLFFVITWKYFGFHMILYLAGRQNIPDELIESAMIDGATPWQTFRHVTLPLLGPTIRISVFLAIIGTIQLFDMVWVFTKGGPIHASETMAYTMWEYGFRRSEVGYASAISVAMFIISFVFAMFYQRFVMRRDIEGAVTGMQEAR
ncbi:sugar ABC transporter permease [Actinophytocola sp.]|uniref:carbohydrate ABC transporter permease n=1 Tax=Actinophytocola sp. TaxID=1872138 RepID=UPI002D7F6643|nr:sugar ABC transporter permease [Actinophytocola sp.]HET9137989.1 sugar ABC transporter permease [Actinophytocola sp.]